MSKTIKVGAAVCLLILAFSLYCGRQPTETMEGDVRFRLSVRYVKNPESNLSYAPQLEQAVYKGHSAAEPMQLQSIDLARVLVADLSDHDDLNDFLESNTYEEFQEDYEDLQENLTSWGEWEKLVKKHFKVITNQTLDIGRTSAKGTVQGVRGLNFIFVALLENNEIQYDSWGDTDAFVEGRRSEQEVVLDMNRRTTEDGDGGDIDVNITSPRDGDVIDERTVLVQGTVSDPTVTSATMIVNSLSQSISVANGGFSNEAILSSGTNRIRVEVRNAQGQYGYDEITITSNVALVDIRITLKWDTDETDLDLYVTDPNNETVYFDELTSRIGGELDVDDPDGYGPENFTLDRGEAIQGNYTVVVRHYPASIYGPSPLPSNATVVILLHEGQSNESTRTYGPHRFTYDWEVWQVTTITWP
jgi:uncharacterized protein YfaP (DUF2135 family)